MLINGKEIKTTNDALAKYIFTTEGSEELSKDFANAVLDDLNFRTVDDFILTSPVFSPTKYDGKTNILDVCGKTSKNDQFGFEIQRQNHNGFDIRLINIASRLFENIQKSTDYGKYPNVYVIALANFIFKLPVNVPVFHDCFCYSSIVNKKSKLSCKSQIHVLEIPKWDKIYNEPFTPDSLKRYTQLDYWMKFFSDKTTYEEIEIMAAQNIFINSAKNKIDQFVLNDENIKAYSVAEEAERVRRAEIDFAVDVAKEEARNERDVQYISSMIKDNLKTETIAKYSGLSPERIEEIRATLQ